MKKLILTLSLIVVTITVMAVPAKPGLWKTLKLSDGTEVRARLVGDEHGHWMQDVNGVCYVERNGAYVVEDQEVLLNNRNARIAKRAPHKVVYASTSDGLGEFGKMSLGAVPSIGEYTIPVVMVQFSDLKFKNTTTVEKMTRYYNEEGYSDGGAVGSVRDYFKQQSGGQFIPTFEVVGIVTLTNSYKDYGENDSYGNDKNVDLLPRDVIAAAVSQLGADFSQYVVPAGDANHKSGVPLLAMFYAGVGEATEDNAPNHLWPCEWDAEEDPIAGGNYADVHFNSFFIGNELGSGGSKLMGCAVFCHEFGHALGLPDFYYSSGYYSDDAFGLWSIMDSGAYVVDDCTIPAAYNAYEKSYMGWLNLTELDTSVDEVVLNDPTDCNAGSAVIVRSSSTETFILENHQPSTFFPSSYGSGVLVMRIAYDKNSWKNNSPNTSPSKKRACVLTANGAKMYYSAEKNNLYGNSKTAIGELTTYSGSKKDMGIKNVTKNADGTITLTLNGNGGGGGDPVTPQGAVLINETFDNCNGTGGNDGKWNQSIANTKLDLDSDPDNIGWTSDNAYKAYQCVKLGTGSANGLITSPAFTVNGEGTLTFKAGAWDASKDGTNLIVSVPAGFTIEAATRGAATAAATNSVTVEMVKGAFTDFTLTIKGTGTPKLTFEAEKGRFFLDEVKVIDPNYTTGMRSITPTISEGDGTWYDLSGRMLNGKPSQKGVYIFGGKKVVIK